MDQEHHSECLMKEEWATIQERLMNFDEKFGQYAVSQAAINSSNTELITKMMHKIYGNTHNGMSTTIKLNKQLSDSENILMQASVKRLWWFLAVFQGAIFTLISVIAIKIW